MIVVKYGGAAMDDPAAAAAFAEDVVALRRAGEQVVVVHGGGPQVTAHLDRLGVASVFSGGRRVTTAETVRVVRMVLVGEVNRDVVALLNVHGPYAVGLSGEDGGLFTAEQLDPSLGLVGDVTSVDTRVLRALLADGRVPVVASVAPGAGGELYNVNADTAAAALAVALRAERVVFLTDVPGLVRDYPHGGVVARIGAAELEALLPDLDGGFVPKMEACLRAARAGLTAYVLDGRVPHALRDGGGTAVTP